MGALLLSGSLSAQAPNASGDSFPSVSAVAPFNITRSYNVATGILPRAVATNSPGWQTLEGVGPGSSVTQGDFLFLRTDSELKIRTTTDDGVGGSVVAIHQVQGLLVIEFPPTKFLKLLEAQGTGRLEFLAAGQQ